MRRPDRSTRLLFATALALTSAALSFTLQPLAHRSLTPATQHSALSTQSSALAAPLATRSSGSVYFRQTAHYLKDAFLNYWLMHGGVQIYGYPISEEFLQDGVLVQYFERSRFEYRPESARPWQVELTHVGSLATAGRSFPAAQPDGSAETLYFPETRHTLKGAFRDFWEGEGGLSIFGYPISEELTENGITVQYFERARMELAGGRVQLGHLGVELLRRSLASGLDLSAVALQNRPGFQMSFQGEATVFGPSVNWDRTIRLNKGWGNLPQDFVGQGLYAAAPADLHLYGRWARVTRGNRSVFVQFIDVINWPDIPYVRSKGIVIDLGNEAFQALGNYNGGRYEVSFEVFWPGEGP